MLVGRHGCRCAKVPVLLGILDLLKDARFSELEGTPQMHGSARRATNINSLMQQPYPSKPERKHPSKDAFCF